MHCPSCGQQQISNETKFCSRCGMPLTVVSEVLGYGGYLPQLAELSKQSETKWTRKNGVFFSIFWFIFWVPLLTSIFGGVFDIEVLGEICALIGCFGALMIFIYALAFMKRPTKYFDPRSLYQAGTAAPGQHAMGGPAQGNALPPQQTMPASAYAAPHPGNWRDTNDLQPSVTENTTRLLDEETNR